MVYSFSGPVDIFRGKETLSRLFLASMAYAGAGINFRLPGHGLTAEIRPQPQVAIKLNWKAHDVFVVVDVDEDD